MDFHQIADQCLLSPYDIDTSGLQQVIGQILTHEIDYADMYFQYNRSEGWMLEEGIVKSGSFNIEQGVGVRAISGEKTAFAYSDDISMAALESAAKVTRAISSHGGNQSVQVIKRTAMEKVPLLYLPDDPITSLEDTEKVLLLEKLENYARKLDARVIQVMASLAGEYEVVLVMRSDGVLAADVRPLVRLSLQVIAEENGRREQGMAGGGGRFDYAYFTEEILRDYAAKAVQQAVTNLNARPAPAGAMTVVLGNGWPGILLHEAIGHGLEGDFNRKGSSAFTGRVGQRVAAEGVTVVDDGSTDDSLAIARAIADRDPRVTVIAQENSGTPAIPRNRAIEAATTPFIACLDADDMYEPDALRVCVDVLEADPALGIAYPQQRDVGRRSCLQDMPVWSIDGLAAHNFLPSGSVFRRQAWVDAGGYRTDVGYEDWDFWLGIVAAGWSAAPAEGAVWCYRHHGESRFTRERANDQEIKARIILNHQVLYPDTFVAWAERVMRGEEPVDVNAPAGLMPRLASRRDRVSIASDASTMAAKLRHSIMPNASVISISPQIRIDTLIRSVYSLARDR